MDDIRRELYEHYVSQFKRHQIGRDEASLLPYWRWCDFKYLPALREVGKDDPILELGSGPGYMLEYLLRRGYRNVQGIDLSQEQVDIALSRGLPAARADVFQFLEGKGDQLAAIIAIDFVEHFTREELFRLFPRIHGALREGGLLLLQTANGQALFPGRVIYGDLSHMTIFNESSMTQLLKMAGFRNVQYSETGPVPDTWKGKIRTVLWRIIRTVAGLVKDIEVRYPPGIWTENFICVARK